MEAAREYLDHAIALQEGTGASDFVRVPRGILEDLLKRLSAVEAKTGIATADPRPQHHIELSPDTRANIVSMTERLFGATAIVQEMAGDLGEDDYILVKVKVGESADPREMATKHSVWHGKLTELKVADPNVFRLQVTYT